MSATSKLAAKVDKASSKASKPKAPAGGQVAKTGPTSEAGPLGRVDAASPATPGVVIRPPLAVATRTIALGMAILIASLFVFGLIAQGVRSQEVFILDTWATPFLHGIASPTLDAVMNLLTDIGSTLVIGPIFVLIFGALLLKRRYGGALFLVVALTGSLVLQGTMKLFFMRPRLVLAYAQVLPDYSFPSGHTMNAIIFYVALALLAWSVFGRQIGLLSLAGAIIIALLVGMSRIYLGYHYFTDVLGGLFAGVAWLLVVGAAFRARPTWRQWRTKGSPGSPNPDGALR